MERTVQDRGAKRESLKKTFVDPRRQREESVNEIRKSKREQQLEKRRNVGAVAREVTENEIQMDPQQDTITPNQSSSNLHNIADAQPRDEAMLKELAMLPQYVAAIQGFDPSQQLQATIQVRKMLSIERSPPITEVIQSNVVPRLIQLLQATQYSKLVFEAAWVLTNIASGNSEQTRYLVEQGAVPAFISLLLHTNDDDLKEQAIWALGNIAGDSTQCRDYVLSQGLMGPLLTALSQPSAKLSMVRNATWTLSNLCRGKPQPPFNILLPALPILNQLVRNADVEVIIDACWAFSYISDGTDQNIQSVLDCGCASRMVSLLNHPHVKVQVPALRTIGNIITGNEAQTQVLLDHNVLPLLYRLLQSPRKAIRKEACWTISNIVAGSPKHTNFVITSNVIPMIIKLLGAPSDLDVKKEAAWVISNASSFKNPEHIKYLVNTGCIKPMCDLLSVSDNKLIMIVLEALENILAVGETLVKNRAEQSNPYTVVIEEAEGIERIEQLQNHENRPIYEKAVKILETYFDASESNDALAPTISTNQQTYNFGSNVQPTTGSGFIFS